MYFEIIKNGKVVKRGRDLLETPTWSNELMYVPSATLTLPITYHDYFTGREEVRVFLDDKCFWGIVLKIEEDKAEESMEVSLEHVVHEWTYRQISVNNAIKDKNINFVYKGSEVKTEGDITVTASPFTVLLSEVESFTNAQYITRAGASAWTSTGEQLTVMVDYSAVQAEAGSYDVIFSAGDVKVTVKCTVSKEADITEPDLDPGVIDQLSDIYTDQNFAYPGWVLNMSDKAKDTVIDYVYSRQNKLEALTKTMELTEDLFWRVKFYPKKEIDISEFGEKKNYIFSKKPSGRTNIQILKDPVITHEFEHVINVATVYAEKSDSGMSSMTLREIYESPELQEPGFPVVILRAGVNNERDYRMYEQYPKLAPNNELEYAVIDEESVALEGGKILEGTFAFNDLAPFNTVDDNGETREITDEDRIKAAKTAYHAAIRKLKESRRRYTVSFKVRDFPVDLNVGDKARLLYDNSVLILETCSRYLKHILSYDDWFYITKVDYDDEYTVTMEKYLRIDRDISEE